MRLCELGRCSWRCLLLSASSYVGHIHKIWYSLIIMTASELWHRAKSHGRRLNTVKFGILVIRTLSNRRSTLFTFNFLVVWCLHLLDPMDPIYTSVSVTCILHDIRPLHLHIASIIDFIRVNPQRLVCAYCIRPNLKSYTCACARATCMFANGTIAFYTLSVCTFSYDMRSD